MSGTAVPEAAIEEDRESRTGKDEVRAAADGREWSPVHIESEATTVQG